MRKGNIDSSNWVAPIPKKYIEEIPIIIQHLKDVGGITSIPVVADLMKKDPKEVLKIIKYMDRKCYVEFRPWCPTQSFRILPKCLWKA